MKYIAFLSLIVLFSCEKRQLDDCITSRGPERTEVRSLETFSQIKLNDRFDVVLIQDTLAQEQVTITGGMNLFPGIDTRVEEGVLIVEDKNTCNFVRTFKEKIVLEIRLKAIDLLEVTSAVKVETGNEMHLENLTILHSGLHDIELKVQVEGDIVVQSINSGGVKLVGSAKKIKGSIEEISALDARDLLTEEALLDSHSRLDCFINATQLIFVKIYNDGNIWYVTEPSGLKEVNVSLGDGKLLKL